ncbi:MAG: hypothetical protein OEL83_17435 [Desulforhopalus sp.]|nr:hypothetical protein [Desulforhopalus sp.]
MMNKLEDFKSIKCPYCNADSNWKIVKIIDSAERPRYPYACVSCNALTQYYEKAKNVPIEIVNSDPILQMDINLDVCERCRELTHVEVHHWGPKKFFADAEDWPKSMLCRACHAEWHREVTKDDI